MPTLGCPTICGQSTQGAKRVASGRVEREHLTTNRDDHRGTHSPARGVDDPPECSGVVIRSCNPQVRHDVTHFLPPKEGHATHNYERQVGDFEQSRFNWAHLRMGAGQDGDFFRRATIAKSFLDIGDDQRGFTVRLVRRPEPDLIANCIFGPEAQSRRLVSAGGISPGRLSFGSR